jgi:hypothetical protein
VGGNAKVLCYGCVNAFAGYADETKVLPPMELTAFTREIGHVLVGCYRAPHLDTTREPRSRTGRQTALWRDSIYNRSVAL